LDDSGMYLILNRKSTLNYVYLNQINK